MDNQPASQAAPIAYWSQDADAVMRGLNATAAGLSDAEAAERLRTHGSNALEDKDHAGPLKLILRQFESPLVLILLFGAGISFLLHDYTEGSIILAIVLGSAALGFFQEYHASRAIEALRKRMALMSRVLRGGAEKQVRAADIVPGDLVLLSAGNLIPADGRILEAQDFLVSEASLTGEPFPIEKKAGVIPADTPLATRSNSAFAGSSVRSGSAKVLICTTGSATMFGGVAARLRAREPETEFAHGLRKFGYLLLQVMIVMVVFVLTINQLLHRPFLESLLFSVALAVGLSPELLPAIVSVTLSAGARAMAKDGVLVRRLDAIENLGGIDLVCTDKTGTLTVGAVALQQSTDVMGKPSEAVMQWAYLNAAFETGIENPLDQAIKEAGATQKRTTQGWKKIDEIPYDFERKRLTIVVEEEAKPGSRIIITKGAFLETLSCCTTMDRGAGPEPLDDACQADLDRAYQQFGANGLRALALAKRTADPKPDYTAADEQGMCFVGFLTFLDPLKPDAKATLDALRASGVAVKVITGDNRYVAAHVAESLGMDPKKMLCGADVDAAKGPALSPIAEPIEIFAEIDPAQKERIVKALKLNGHSVGFMGDGVNDAPALHAADVGISVNTAVDVAREAADVILLQPDLGVLRKGIENGRRAYANTLKYICITTGSSFGNMVSMALATPLLPFLPLTAAQVLVTNFLTDLPLIAVSTDNVDPERVAAPLRWSVRDIQIFMVGFGLLSSVFDIITFFVLLRVFHAQAIEFQSTWFVVSVLTELVALLVLRTMRPAWNSAPGKWIVWGSIAVAIIGCAAPYIPPVAGALALQPLPLPLLVASVVIVIAYGLATEAAKEVIWRRRGGVAARAVSPVR